MYLGPSLLPAAAAYLKDALMRTLGSGASNTSEVDWTNKAAVVAWIREQGKSERAPGRLLDKLPFASLPPAILADLDVGLAVADIEPAALVKLSPVLLRDPDIVRRAVCSDSAARHLFAPELLRQLTSAPSANEMRVAPLSELELALMTVRARPLSLGELPLPMRGNPEVVSAAAGGDPVALVYASQNLWADTVFMKAHLPQSPDASSRVLAGLLKTHGDAGTAHLLSNRRVAAMVCGHVDLNALPPKTRDAANEALATMQRTRLPGSPRRPSPFSDS